jgi:phosphate:Na+ symporter
MDKPLYGIVAGAVFTLIVNSSAATVGIAIALASDGLLTLPAGIALALGANIGTCGTALIAALGKPVDAVRAATVHVMFNVIGVVLWFPFIGLLAKIAVSISPAGDDLAAVLPRQIANANTMFNILNTIFFIGFTGWFAKIATRLVKDKGPEKALVKPKFLDEASIAVPAIALENVRQEVARLGDIVRAMLVDFPSEPGSTTSDTLDEISRQGKRVNVLEIAILDFLARIRQGDLTQTESQAHVGLASSAIHFRNIAGIITEDLVNFGRASVSGEIEPGALKRTALSEFYRSVQLAVELAVKAVHRSSDAIVEQAEAASIQIKKFAEELMSQAATGLEASDPKSLRTVRLQATFVEGLRQISSLAQRIVRIAQ